MCAHLRIVYAFRFALVVVAEDLVPAHLHQNVVLDVVAAVLVLLALRAGPRVPRREHVDDALKLLEREEGGVAARVREDGVS